MINTIRESKVTKVISCYLAIQIIVQMIQPIQIMALTSGPTQPEFNAFTPIGTSDMVDLASGNFNYNIPIMDVGGYPLNLAYDSGVRMDEEASWVGLGWNLNVGQINRQVRGLPDDFKGDVMEYEKNIRPNITAGVSVQADVQIFGVEKPDEGGSKPPPKPTPTPKPTIEVKVSVGVNLKYNNYTGVTFKPSVGLAFDVAGVVTAGLDVETSAVDGVTVLPSVSATGALKTSDDGFIGGSLNAGVSYNSNQGLANFTYGFSVTGGKKSNDGAIARKFFGDMRIGSHSGAISFNSITMTPRKRTSFINNNATVAISLGGDIFGTDLEAEVIGMGSVQKLKEPISYVKSYGYDFTGFATPNDIKDYNRENDRAIRKTTSMLPVTNYTYDLYTVQGQGIGGMFRPFRSQIGQINDNFVEDVSADKSLGVEIEPGAGYHYGGNFKTAPSISRTGLWDTDALNNFIQEREDVKHSDEKLDYEPVYYKYIGEPRVDKDQSLFEDLGDYAPIALKIGGDKKKHYKYADNQFRVKRYTDDLKPFHKDLGGNFGKTYKFKRKNRDVRNQSIQKISVRELGSFYGNQKYANSRINKSAETKPHHTAEIRVQKGDGATYVFGETAYNNIKKEVTFATETKAYNCAEGTVRYNTGDNTLGNSAGLDNFYDSANTPAYAHTYLLSSIFSSDYEDINGDGPTDDDLGSYTNFIYEPLEEDYKWRIPYDRMKASYNAGLNTVKSDQKGNYVYGEKEIKYIKKIETKTHVALFYLSKREDARGVIDYNGGGDDDLSASMKKIDSIALYSKSEYEPFKEDLEDMDPSTNPTSDQITAIKTAHFTYNYSLCKGVKNNFNPDINQRGKLTLDKVHFTYRNSKMGTYTPYTFNYDGFNPDYNIKSYDVWGNYKPIVKNALEYENEKVVFEVNKNGIEIPKVNPDFIGGDNGFCNSNDPITAPEFAFVQQNDRTLQNAFASAWTLTSIDLPSGGKINLEYESDDYQFVQDKNTMQMFKVVGAGLEDRPGTPANNNKLYKLGNNTNLNILSKDARFLYVQLPDETDPEAVDFKAKYLKGITDKPIFFRFFMNMTKAAALNQENSNYDYVTGYFLIDDDYRGIGSSDISVFKAVDKKIYASIPMKFTDLEGGLIGGTDINPISKAGMFFGRKYMNAEVYGINADYRTEDFVTIAEKVVGSFKAAKDILTGPNLKLRGYEYLCAQRFIPEKSWIRLTTPKKYKLGGGVRVKKLIMKDEWGKLIDKGDVAIANNEKYNKEYGQEYEYTLEDTSEDNVSSSGVATFEPNDSKENPFVEPIYDNAERLIAPREVNYIEKPVGKSFFPGASVTYSRVKVSNLKKEGVTTHATGKVVTEHYTSKNYPTEVDFTDLDNNYSTDSSQFLDNLLSGLFGGKIHSRNEYALSQGFVVHTNDMNGKVRSQKVYAENSDDAISSVEYKYSTDNNSVDITDDSTDDSTDISKLNNKLTVINSDGRIETDRQIGIDYDVVTDFRESYNQSKTQGIAANLTLIPILGVPTPIPSVFPINTEIENVAYSTITTKVIHTTAVLKETIAKDLGSRVSTINEAWDAQTGQVLLTRTINEHDDEYFSFNFPAYWSYENMGQASKNIGITGTLKNSGEFFTMQDADTYFTVGDEIVAKYLLKSEKLWVVGFNNTRNGVLLMNSDGGVINRSNGVEINKDIQFKIVRSGHRNQQMANMASITMIKNPIKGNDGKYLKKINTQTFTLNENTALKDNQKIINASAVEYTDFWNCQCENQMPFVAQDINLEEMMTDITQDQYPISPVQFNPYLYNAKGEWRAKRSYAYLTERTDVNNGTATKLNTRREGYFKEFTPYYSLLESENKWKKPAQSTNPDDANNAWTFASEVTQYSPFGAELENRDALNRFSSAQYGYNYTLPTAVASNSEYSDMGTDGFEDYSYLNTEANEAHFNFKTAADLDGDGGITVSEDVSHSGRTSLNVPSNANKSADLPINLMGELPPDTNYDNDDSINLDDNCPYTSNNQADYDGDGIGDMCDDDPIPEITKVEYLDGVLPINYGGKDGIGNDPWYEFCLNKRLRVTIHGNPNEIVPYGVTSMNLFGNGFSAFVNKKLTTSAKAPELNWVYRSDQERHIRLDLTGKAVVFIDLAVRNRRENDDNFARIKFELRQKNNTSLAIFRNGRSQAIKFSYQVNEKSCGANYNRGYILIQPEQGASGWDIQTYN